jgi:hypothetical protein
MAGVSSAAIAADYGLSWGRLSARYAARGEEDQGPLLRSFLQERGTTAEALIIELLAQLDVEAHLRQAGLTARDVNAVRARLIIDYPDPPPT